MALIASNEYVIQRDAIRISSDDDNDDDDDDDNRWSND
jgi:hypothetical protein